MGFRALGFWAVGYRAFGLRGYGFGVEGYSFSFFECDRGGVERDGLSGLGFRLFGMVLLIGSFFGV